MPTYADQQNTFHLHIFHGIQVKNKKGKFVQVKTAFWAKPTTPFLQKLNLKSKIWKIWKRKHLGEEADVFSHCFNPRERERERARTSKQSSETTTRHPQLVPRREREREELLERKGNQREGYGFWTFFGAWKTEPWKLKGFLEPVGKTHNHKQYPTLETLVVGLSVILLLLLVIDIWFFVLFNKSILGNIIIKLSYYTQMP